MAIWSKLVCFPEMIANCLGRFCLASHTFAYLSGEDVFLGSVKFDGSPSGLVSANINPLRFSCSTSQHDDYVLPTAIVFTSPILTPRHRVCIPKHEKLLPAE